VADITLLPPTPRNERQTAALELLRRKRARTSLVEYARSIDIPGAPIVEDALEGHYKPVDTTMALHHIIISNRIQQTMEKPFGRLMILAPPGSAKSSYASVVAPAWKLSQQAGYRIILASYAQEIANKQSRKARSVCRQPAHISIWPDRPILSNDQKAVHQWALSNGSEFMAAGIQAGITGNRANGLVIDDPFKNRLEADSETIRQRVREEFEDSAKTRLLPGGWIILINTRWHEDDLSGGLLPEDYAGQSGPVLCRDGQWWDVLNIPAKAEHSDDPLGRTPGEYLWPEWFPQQHWAQWEHNPRAARTWAALFQQRPKAGEGLEFKREWFQWYDPDVPAGNPGGRPERTTFYGATDMATKEDKGDFSEHGIAGMDEKGDLYFVDWWYGQKTTDVTINNAVALMARWKPWRWADEGGPIDNAIRPALKKAMREATGPDGQPAPVHTPIESLTSIKNKAVKLASLQARVAARKVWLPLKRPWATRLVDQLCAFPAGKYDDAADTAGLIARLIDVMMSPHQPGRVEKSRGVVPFTGEWLESTDHESVLRPRYF
jgi:predicted phage terminase large subunit-like protein